MQISGVARQQNKNFCATKSSEISESLTSIVKREAGWWWRWRGCKLNEIWPIGKQLASYVGNYVAVVICGHIFGLIGRPIAISARVRALR